MPFWPQVHLRQTCTPPPVHSSPSLDPPFADVALRTLCALCWRTFPHCQCTLYHCFVWKSVGPCSSLLRPVLLLISSRPSALVQDGRARPFAVWLLPRLSQTIFDSTIFEVECACTCSSHTFDWLMIRFIHFGPVATLNCLSRVHCCSSGDGKTNFPSPVNSNTLLS